MDTITDLLSRQRDPRFGYMMLDRLRCDCEYFLGAGRGAEKHLWAGSVPAQIDAMRRLRAALPEEPEWLTTERLDGYERRMTELLNRKTSGIHGN